MTNTLFLPELREMLAENDSAGLREFCEALHPAASAEFMEGLTVLETWEVIKHAEAASRTEIFRFFELAKQVEMIEALDRQEMAGLIGELPPDDRVDILKDAEPEVVEQIMPLVPEDERRDIIRLGSHPEGTAGAMMTSEFARLSETATVKQALEELGRQAEELETIYYLYVVDDADHLRGVLTARQLVSAMRRQDQVLGDLMERRVVSVDADEDQEAVAQKVAQYDFLAIPVVDQEHRLLGIITHDDVIDVMLEEAVEDAQRIGAVNPLEETYLDTAIYTMAWKRGLWLTVLFCGALLTALALDGYRGPLDQWKWLVLFIPLVVSSGGNSGSQSATLIISALAAGHVTLSDSLKIVGRELAQGLILGGFLATIGYFATWWLQGSAYDATVIPATIMIVVICGTLLGAMLPLLFKRIGLDPAMMSTPFIAGIIDVLGIVIYMTVAMGVLTHEPAAGFP